CRVVLSKRDDGHVEPLSPAEIARAKAIGRWTLNDHEEMEARAKRDKDDADFQRYFDLFKGRTTVLDIYGVEKKNGDDQVFCPECGKFHAAGTKHPVSPPQPLAETQKSNPSPEVPMDKKTNLAELAKRAGVVAIAKAIVDEDHSFGITEPELTDLVIAEAKKNHPELTDAQAFAKVYSEQSEGGVVLRRAFQVAKNSAYQGALDSAEKDAAAACAELTKIGKDRWPSLTPAQRFARAFETNPELAKRAHRRPSVFGAYPHPVAKAVPLTNATPPATKPVTTTETDPVSPEAALAQLREIGRQRWPSASAAQQFMNAVTDVNNVDLVTAALRRTGSSPARK